MLYFTSCVRYTYGHCLAICYGCAASIAGNFLTQTIGRFRYSTVKTNLFNAAPYVVGTIYLLITSWSSNWFRERGFHLASSFVLALIGCIILIALPVSQMGAGYFATFLVTAGAFTPRPYCFIRGTSGMMQVKTVECSTSGPTVSRIPLLLIACDRHTDLHIVSPPGEYRRYRLHQHFPSQNRHRRTANHWLSPSVYKPWHLD